MRWSDYRKTGLEGRGITKSDCSKHSTNLGGRGSMRSDALGVAKSAFEGVREEKGGVGKSTHQPSRQAAGSVMFISY